MSELHNCTPGHGTVGNKPVFPSANRYFSAADTCAEDERGRLWVKHTEIEHMIEYATQANFCPFCGYRARVQIKWRPPQKDPCLFKNHQFCSGDCDARCLMHCDYEGPPIEQLIQPFLKVYQARQRKEQ